MAISTGNPAANAATLGTVLGAIAFGGGAAAAPQTQSAPFAISPTTAAAAPPPGTVQFMQQTPAPIQQTTAPIQMQPPMAPPINPNIQYDTSGFNKFNNVTIQQALTGQTPPSVVDLHPVLRQQQYQQPVQPTRTAPVMPFFNTRARGMSDFRAPFERQMRRDNFFAPSSLSPQPSPRPIKYGGY